MTNSYTPLPSQCFSSLTKEQEESNQKIYKQFTQLVATYPCVNAGISYDFYRHPDGWYIPLHVLVNCLMANHFFISRPTDIILATYPKSGTTWLKSILFATMHRNKFAIRDNDNANPLNMHSPHECVPFLEMQLYTGVRVPDLELLPSPRLFATHIPFRSLPESIINTDCKIIYLCRGPKDNFVSAWHFLKKNLGMDKDTELQASKQAVEFFCNGVAAFGSVWDHILGYWKAHLQNPNKVLFLTYEGLKEDTFGHVKRVAEFVGFPFTEEEEKKGVVQDIVEMCGIERLSNLEANRVGKVEFTEIAIEKKDFFRRGVVNDWVNHLTPEMARRIDEVTESKFKGIGLTLM